MTAGVGLRGKSIAGGSMEAMEKMGQDWCNEMTPAIVALTEQVDARRVEITPEQIRAVHQRLEAMAEELKETFGESPDLLNAEFQRQMKTNMQSIFFSILGTVANNPSNFTSEADMSEIVFSDRNGLHPILATASLGPCVGLAGYDPVNKFGFVAHIVTEKSIETSGAMLLERINAYRVQNDKAPLLIHLRGGIKGMSESTVEKIKDLITSNGLPSIIASEDILQDPIIPGTGIPAVPGSIKLDVRTGTCERYDPMTNSYSKMQGARELTPKQIEDFVTKEAFFHHNAIKIVYDSKVDG